MEIWEPKSSGTLQATLGLLGDCFTIFLLSRGNWHIEFIFVKSSDNNNVYLVQLSVNAFYVDMTVLLYWCFSSMSCYMLQLKLTNE